ncbi:MAG: Ig-like domain-containing protein [bacterium]
MLTRLKKKHPLAFSAVALMTIVTMCVWAAVPACALTPAGTQITAPAAAMTGKSAGTGQTVSKTSNTPSTVTVKDVYGVTWTVTPSNSTTIPGSALIYKYTFKHTGNVGISPIKDTFYYTATGTWVAGLYVDAAATTPATGQIQLPPNSGNEFAFYMKVAPPTGADGQSATATVTVKNSYFNTNNANDGFGDPDRVLHTVTTSTSDITPPFLSVSGPSDKTILITSNVDVTGISEAGITISVVVQPASGTHTATVDISGNFKKNIPLNEGDNTITVTARDAAGNTKTETKTVSVDTVKPAAAITFPAADAAVSGTIDIIGTAWDTNFKEYSLHYGPGSSPTVWGTIKATSTLPISNTSLGAWDTSSLFGNYTIRLTAVDTFGNSSTVTRQMKVGNAYSLSATIPQGRWTMLSLPGQPLNSVPQSFLGSSRYEIQRWNPALSAPDPYLLNYERSFLITTAGVGFWIKPYEQNIAFTTGATVPDTTKDYYIHLYAGWNQIGVPYNREMLWDWMRVKKTVTGEVKTMAEAIAAGWVDSSFYAYGDGGYVQKGAGFSMIPYEGYFVRVYEECDLIVNPGAGMPGGVARIVRPEYEWKLRISAESTSGRDVENFVGIMKGAEDGFDGSDSAEPPPVKPYLSLYFPHDDWGHRAGRFTQDIRSSAMTAAVDGAAPEKTWRFVVETSAPGDAVVLRFPDADSLPPNYEILIRDEAAGAVFNPREKEIYNYTDSTGEREFSITAKKLGMLPEVELPLELPAGWSLISVPLEPEQTDARVQLGDDLKDIAVFQYYDRELYHPESPEHVDIQAGLGYWIYVDKTQLIDFKGVRTDSVKPVEVPLTEGWNLIGNPYETITAFGDNISVRSEGETVSLSEAVARGWIKEPIYSYLNNENRYAAVKQGDKLQEWRGYIIKAAAPCVLIIGK